VDLTEFVPRQGVYMGDGANGGGEGIGAETVRSTSFSANLKLLLLLNLQHLN